MNQTANTPGVSPAAQLAATSAPKSYPAPVFVTGVMPRSGTNFLYNLLCMHPHCEGVTERGMAEDHFLPNSKLLERFTNNVASFWCRHGRQYDKFPHLREYNETMRQRLFRSLGEGLLVYLRSRQSHPEQPLLTKTPSVENLDNFFKLFPQARLIIVMRDGRAVVESNVKSFDAKYELTMQRWAIAALQIIEFQRSEAYSPENCLIVKYEDILNDFDATLGQVLSFLGLDPAAYNFAEARAMPVFGSSENFTKDGVKAGDKPTGWKVIEKNSQFQPLVRWRHWSPERHHRFNWVAGEAMRAFGYELQHAEGSGASSNQLKNKLQDLQWALTSGSVTAAQRLERFLYAFAVARRDFNRFRMEN